MDVQLPAQPVDQSGLSEQRPLETQDGCPTGQGKDLEVIYTSTLLCCSSSTLELEV